MSNDDSKVIGVLLFTRHGDRQGFYQDPNTYTASATSITPLGEVQQYQLGSHVRATYFNEASPSYIPGIAGFNTTVNELLETEQVLLSADASDEGGVIYDSALAFSQGLWPTTPLANTTLANGTTVVAPLGGYQYVPVTSINSDLDVSLEGWTKCPNSDAATTAFYATPGFKAVAEANTEFLANLTDIVGGKPVNLQNMWNIFDYMNVQSIHNATFAASCPPAVLAQARTLANYHESGVFSSSDPKAINNVGATALFPNLFTSLNRLANTSDPLLFQSVHMSYKPFLGLFELFGISNITAQRGLKEGASKWPAYGIINYAGSTAFEVRTAANGTGEPFVRVLIKNGTDDANYVAYPVTTGNSSNTDTPLSSFISAFKPYALTTRSAWCTACGNNSTRTCDLITQLNSTTTALHDAQAQLSHHHGGVSRVGAGFIGFGVTFGVVLILLALAALLGLVSFGKRRERGSNGAGNGAGKEKI